VVADFRARDVAAGGEGAPLAPLIDYLVLRSDTIERVALNIGGVANVSHLPAGCAREDVLAYDTGPGNAVLDEIVSLSSGGAESYDADGARARAGRADASIVERALEDPYFAQVPPKSTGRDVFGRALARSLWADATARGLPLEDVLASAVEITARSIADAVRRFHPGGRTVQQIVASGGGVHNAALMDALRAHAAPAEVILSDECGLPVDAKEAILFAVLAHETLRGRPGMIRRVTGATHDVVLGSITPGRLDR
jgi:anhydro-N-acetylmuramic acid kinase